ncbi:hypothetical protein CIHG_04884 [Coccidioides immitis H538.4]|uniref:Uncharacterized protein n=1 Tax=Coccidioides immitis H538.4 TaxID=396776 RepID=A0A0J8RSL6_COCIT|nr:hypothetical protein CIHG_04884 [Coccidioides immitis H538.4]
MLSSFPSVPIRPDVVANTFVKQQLRQRGGCSTCCELPKPKPESNPHDSDQPNPRPGDHDGPIIDHGALDPNHPHHHPHDSHQPNPRPGDRDGPLDPNQPAP